MDTDVAGLPVRKYTKSRNFHGIKIVRNSRGNVTTFDFYGTIALTNESTNLFFQMQNFGACLDYHIGEANFGVSFS